MKARLPILTAGFVLLLGTQSALLAQEPKAPKPAPDDQTGLDIGTAAPNFTLKDQNGDDRSLADLLKKGNVALVFYRSADW